VYSSATEVALVPAAAPIVTSTVGADVEPGGAAGVIWLGEFTVKLEAATDPNVTAVAPEKWTR
jgi:catabolite regulation protein CreA